MDQEEKNFIPESEEDDSWLDAFLASSNYGDDALQEIQDLPLPSDDEILKQIMGESTDDDWDLSKTILNDSEDYGYPQESPIENPQPAQAEEIWKEEPVHDEENLEEDFIESDRKVRPKKKDTYGLFGLPHFVSTIILVLMIAAVGISLGRLLWVCATDVLAFGREDRATTITITKADEGNIDAIADKLYNAGLIQYKQLFRIYAALSNADEKISAGTFELNTLFDYNALVKGMSSSSSYRETVTVTIPEGYTCAQIFALLEQKGVCSVQELKTYEVQSDYWFLAGANKNAEYPLEGFLFPDTYDFYINDTPKGVFRRFLARFDGIFTDEMKAYVETSDYSFYEIITVASMIEKESAGSRENYNVSSVIYNRLNNPSVYPTLDIDATIVYAQGGYSEVINKDLDSPYNTYKYKGLPPTPISSPSLLSIQAALSPAKTDYYFYALDPSTGLHHFSKNYKEHQDFLNSIRS